MPYNIRNYPKGNNTVNGLPWAPATDGLRNITGAAAGGYAAIWATTSTVSGNGDTGADPNQLVVVFDSIQNTDPAVAARESFFTIRQAGFGEVLRGVSFTPEASPICLGWLTQRFHCCVNRHSGQTRLCQYPGRRRP